MIALRHDYFLQDVYLISCERNKVESIHNLTFLHLCWRDLKWLSWFTVFSLPTFENICRTDTLLRWNGVSWVRIHVGCQSLSLLREMKNVEQGSVDQALCLDLSRIMSFLTFVFRILLLTKSNSTASRWSSRYGSGAAQLHSLSASLHLVAVVC